MRQHYRMEALRKRCVVFCAMDEFHHFSRTNAWIYSELRSKYDEIFVVAPIAAAPILSSADLIITNSVSTGSLYPDILTVMNQSRNVFAYKKTGLFEEAMNYLSSFQVDDMYMYTGTETDHAPLTDLFGPKVNLVLSPSIPHDFGLIAKAIRDGLEIVPFSEDVDLMFNRYKDFFGGDNRTLLVLTRNFESKQPFYNSSKKGLINLIRLCFRNGFSVINVGVPPLSINYRNSPWERVRSFFVKRIPANYLELDGLTYSETLAVAALSDVWSIVPHAGGFSIHIMSQGDLIISGKEFCQTDNGEWLKDVRKSVSGKRTFSSFQEFLRVAKTERSAREIRSISLHKRVIDLSKI